MKCKHIFSRKIYQNYFKISFVDFFAINVQIRQGSPTLVWLSKIPFYCLGPIIQQTIKWRYFSYFSQKMGSDI